MHTVEDSQFYEGGAFVSFLNNLEATISPASCTFYYFNYWPIIRFAINYKRKFGQPFLEGDVPELTADQVIALQNVIEPRTRPTNAHNWRQKRRLARLPRSEVVFLNRKTLYDRPVPGMVSLTLLDGLRLITGVGDTALSLVDADPRVKGETFSQPTRVLPKSNKTKIVQLLNPRNRFELDSRDRILRSIRAVNDLIRIDGSGLEVNEWDVLSRIENTVRMMDFYGQILDRVQPRFIFLTSYSGAHYVCAAARKRGIKVVDVQHGSMHRHHFLASHWSNIPVDGYELLPDIFWCWSRRSANYVQFPGTQAHRAMIGGNPKAALESMMEPVTQISPAIASEASQSIGEPEKNATRRVVVALQYGKDVLLPDHVIAAYEKTKGKVAWSFRLHPRGWNRLEELLQVLDIERKDVEAASKAPLKLILSEVDVVLTDASTIVHEAIEFGAAPGVWSRKGSVIFDDLIEGGSLKFVGDADQVVALVLHGSRNQNRAESFPDTPSSQADLIRTEFRKLVGETIASPWHKLRMKMRSVLPSG
ncbi:hypothetical protein [Roseobacter litoralis]|uniref:hypothetical protein n=1 Tax=Roseobacter litoralis TaxID=42443 RepID=UPI00249597BD|nr:hypothetical protein [Roseobacter litoralis]